MLKPQRTRKMFQEAIQKKPIEVYGLQANKGRFGVELELEGGVFPEIPGWHHHVDNSVPRGIEYVFGSPHDLDGVRVMMEKLNRAFRENETQFRYSYRASTHIHFNVQRESMIDVLGLVTLFQMIEPIFMRLCGNDRDGNLFCLTSYDTGESHLHFEQWLSHISKGYRNEFPRRGKYTSLNVNPLPVLGSLEFRSFPSTHDTEKVLQWCSWLENMMTFVKKQRDKSFRDMYIGIKHDVNVLHEIFGKLDLPTLCHPMTPQDMVEIGARQGHESRRLLSLYFRKSARELENEQEDIPF